MTEQNTDAECAEFDAWYAQRYGLARRENSTWAHAEKMDALEVWMAARRAPAAPAAPVPHGWKLVPDEANMTDEQAEAICAVAKVCGGGAYDIYRAALAAAPQPPEAVKANLVDAVLQGLLAEKAKKDALIAKGICPTCEGKGECGGQFTGGEWTCEECNGTGRLHGIK